MKKYRLIESDRGSEQQKLYQIQALRDFMIDENREVKAGKLGGFVSGEHNLSHEGNCWVASPAEVRGNAMVSGNAFVGGFSYLYDNVQVLGNARVTRGHFYNDVKIYDNAVVSVKNSVQDEVEIFGNAEVVGKDIHLMDKVKIFDNAKISSCFIKEIKIRDSVKIYGNAQISGSCYLSDAAEIYGETKIQGNNVHIQDNVKICDVEITGNNYVEDSVQIIGKHIVIGGGLKFGGNAKIINEHPMQRIEMGGEGVIGGNALIRSQNDFIQSQIFSHFTEYLTAYNTENGIEIFYDDQAFSAAQIRQALEAYTEYETAIQLAKSRVLGEC